MPGAAANITDYAKKTVWMHLFSRAGWRPEEIQKMFKNIPENYYNDILIIAMTYKWGYDEIKKLSLRKLKHLSLLIQIDQEKQTKATPHDTI